MGGGCFFPYLHEDVWRPTVFTLKPEPYFPWLWVSHGSFFHLSSSQQGFHVLLGTPVITLWNSTYGIRSHTSLISFEGQVQPLAACQTCPVLLGLGVRPHDSKVPVLDICRKPLRTGWVIPQSLLPGLGLKVTLPQSYPKLGWRQLSTNLLPRTLAIPSQPHVYLGPGWGARNHEANGRAASC